MADIAFRYDATKNPSGGNLPGVPLKDITTEQFERYADWLKDSIRAQPFYIPVEPAPAASRRTRPAKAEAEAEAAGDTPPA